MKSQKGFSLIELMIVISIIAVLATLSISPIINMKIKAARVEATQNMRNIFTLAHTYHAENGNYGPGAGSWYYGTTSLNGVVLSTNCIPNHLGFKIAGYCETNKLRYYYTFNPTGNAGNSVDGTARLYFTILANSTHIDSDAELSYGSVPPTRMCRVPIGSSYGLFFRDNWSMFETGFMQPVQGLQANDALKTCLNPFIYAPPPSGV